MNLESRHLTGSSNRPLARSITRRPAADSHACARAEPTTLGEPAVLGAPTDADTLGDETLGDGTDESDEPDPKEHADTPATNTPTTPARTHDNLITTPPSPSESPAD